MANSVRVKLKLGELNKLMRSAPVQAKVNEEAARIAANAGPKYRITPSSHRYTARAFVEMKPDQSQTDSDVTALLRAVGEASS